MRRDDVIEQLMNCLHRRNWDSAERLVHGIAPTDRELPMSALKNFFSPDAAKFLSDRGFVTWLDGFYEVSIMIGGNLEPKGYLHKGNLGENWRHISKDVLCMVETMYAMAWEMNGRQYSDEQQKELSFDLSLVIIAQGDPELVRIMVQYGTRPDYVMSHCEYPGSSPLHLAVEDAERGLEYIKIFHEFCPDMDCNIRELMNGETPFHWATVENYDIAEFMLEHTNADVNLIVTDPEFPHPNNSGPTPFAFAAAHSFRLFQIMIRRHVEVNHPFNASYSPLGRASCYPADSLQPHERAQIIDYLLNNGADPNALCYPDFQEPDEGTPLIEKIRERFRQAPNVFSPEVLEVFRKHGLPLDEE